MKKYKLKDGSIYWHKLYYACMPRWLCDNSPAGGSYNYAYYLAHPWRLFQDWYCKIKWFIQRGYRGYSDNDTWGLDWYLVTWLPAAIRTIKDSYYHDGHPVGMTRKGWETRLERIADGFDAAREIQDPIHPWNSTKQRQAWRRFNKGMKLFHKHFFSLWD